MNARGGIFYLFVIACLLNASPSSADGRGPPYRQAQLDYGPDWGPTFCGSVLTPIPEDAVTPPPDLEPFAQSLYVPRRFNRNNNDLSARVIQERIWQLRLQQDLLNATQKMRDIRKIGELRIAAFNVENLFEDRGRFQPNKNGHAVKVPPDKLKPEWKRRLVSMPMLEARPDIIAVVEVEHREEASSDFIREHLAKRYAAITLKGNDGRGIGLSLWVRLDLPVKVLYRSHRDLLFDDPRDETSDLKRVFKRDFPVAEIYAVDAKTGIRAEKPFLRIGIVHLKSQRPTMSQEDEIIDPTSAEKRRIEVEAIREIADFYREKDLSVPLLIVGDFQGNPSDTSRTEYRALQDREEFIEAFEHLKLDPESRITQYFFQDGVDRSSQLDAAVMTPDLARVMTRAGVVRARDWSGKTPKELPRPKSFEERSLDRGSDHEMIFAGFNLPRLLMGVGPSALPKPSKP